MKRSILSIVLGLVFVVVFNVIFYVVTGTQHTVSGWLGYAFVHVAYVMLLITPLFVKEGSKSSALFAGVLGGISFWYFFVAFIAGVVFIALNQEDVALSLIIQVVLFALYIILLISNVMANDRTAQAEQVHEMELYYVRDCSQRLESVASYVVDPALQKKARRAYDVVKASPVKSNQAARGYELRVMQLIDQVEGQLDAGDAQGMEETFDQICMAAQERNRALMYA